MLLTYHLWRWFIKKEFLWFLFLNSLNSARLPGHLDTFKTHEMELNIDTLTHRRLTPGALWFVTFSCVQIAAFCPWQVVVKSVVRSPTFWKFFQVAKRESSINYEHPPKNLKNCHKYGPQKTHFLERVFFLVAMDFFLVEIVESLNFGKRVGYVGCIFWKLQKIFWRNGGGISIEPWEYCSRSCKDSAKKAHTLEKHIL